MKLTILGCYSATPQVNTNPTAQVLEIKNHTFLIDCGEGTQVELRRNKVRFSRVKHIFISHLHGDHCFGLAGLISTFNLLNRDADLHIYAPEGLKEIITLQMKLSKSWTSYNLIFHELSATTSELIFEDDKVEVYTIPLDHRVYTNGFLFKEKLGDRKLDMNAVLNAGIDVAYYQKLKQGGDVPNITGEIVANHKVTKDPNPSKSYAFCSDTAFNESVIPVIKDVSVLYHESTFIEKNKDLATSTKHSTAKQAAIIAKRANVGCLILGHYSTRYTSLDGFKLEAESIFSNVELSRDGKQFDFSKL